MNYRLFFRLIVCLIGLLMQSESAARHIIGGDLTYVCLGQSGGIGSYRFTMKVYRDCDGGGAGYDNPAQFAIYLGSKNNNTQYSTFEVFLQEVRRLEPDTPKCAFNIPIVCVEEGIYVFELDLPIQSTDSYFIVYQRCCRNQTISNLIDPGSIGATYMVELTAQAQQVCNNSPTFNNFPPIIICNNLPLIFDHSASDADGDLLRYSFCAPLQGGGPLLSAPDLFSCEGAIPTPPCAPPFDVVPFVTPDYEPGKPMGGNPLITINSITGMITGTPRELGQFVVGVCVEEYRNGKLLSVIEREFQFNVADCEPTVLAQVQGQFSIGTEEYVISSCGQNQLKLINKSVQKLFIKKYEWRFDLKGTTYFNDQDWDPVITFPDTGFYRGTLYLNPGDYCGDTAKINVRIFPSIHADFSYDYDTCVAGPVIFTDNSTGEGGINKWEWQFGVPGGTSTLQDPQFLYKQPGNHPVRLKITDQNKCTDDTLQIIHWFPAPPYIIIKPSSYLGCVPGEIYFDNLSSPVDETYDIKWDFGDGTTVEDVISPTHTFTEPGTYDISVSITSPIGCFVDDYFNDLIRVEPRPVADFICDPDTLLSNFNNIVQFTDQSKDADKWNWTFGKFGFSNKQNPLFTFPDTGKVKVRLIVTHPTGCQDSMSKWLDIRPEIRWFMPNAFTPNHDSENEGFLGKGYLEGATQFEMTIWNRWGEMVYKTNDPNSAWNGRQMNTGGQSPPGVYVYVVSFVGPRGEKNEFKGFATLIR